MEKTFALPITRALSTAWLQSLPVVFGYLPIGFAYGILAQNSGLSAFNTIAMSILVYAGSAQLIAVGLFAGGISPFSIILTTFIVNLRHLLMSAALSPYLRGWPRALIPLFAFELTDETFGVHSVRFAEEGAQPATAIATNLIAQVSWVSGTALGVFAGTLIEDVRPFGIDYALPAMFVALLVFQLKGRPELVVAGLGGLLSVGLLLAGVSQWNVILATVLAAAIGVTIESWIKTSSS